MHIARTLTFTGAFLALLTLTSCMTTPTSVDPYAKPPEQATTDKPDDPCTEVYTWCDAPFVWADDPTGRCYCPCTDHNVCEASPEPSHCGTLLRYDPSLKEPYVRFFPDGYPMVCRLNEVDVPSSPIGE